ncbi:MAG: tRNA (adenosine(37)-N6)-dimethylallyltransferase MiaA, partial [Planctomycetes bacterium RBG_16_64_10]
AADCWFLTGPTAAGKTAIGIELARRINAEIISLDSMAVYRGMDVGTAKPTAAQRDTVPHHLIDIVDPDEEFSTFRYVEAAHAKIAEIRARGRAALFVGGTPLYLKALLRGLLNGPDADWEFRRQIAAELPSTDRAALHRRVALVDPLAAAKLHPNDTRRLIRALEVYRMTGRPISHLQLQFEDGRPAAACRVFVVQWPKPLLQGRIEHRVEYMFAAGLLEEVRQLIDCGRTLGRTASQAVGYREAIDVLQGRCGLDQACQRTKVRTRRFAKRQNTWFRSLSECRTVPASDATTPAEIAACVLHMAGAQ